jgi:hypothetical protein
MSKWNVGVSRVQADALLQQNHYMAVEEKFNGILGFSYPLTYIPAGTFQKDWQRTKTLAPLFY